MREVKGLTGELISVGLAIDQNFPSCRIVRGDSVVGFAGQEELSVTLKSVAYAAAYNDLRQARSFNVLLLDGGIIQLLYYFNKVGLAKHRLSFFPSPNLLEYQNESELYEHDDRYADMIDKGVVTTPLRFDYDSGAFVDVDHPMCHLTVGQYKHCRIPVTGPLTPGLFCLFILRSFYNTPFRKHLATYPVATNSFEQTISIAERGMIHVGVHG